MVELLPLTWYTESPIDFEYKQYVLFDYLQRVEISFINKKLSPHLLHMEKMLIEMKSFEDTIGELKRQFDRHRYIYLFKDTNTIDDDDETLKEIIEIIDFSIPQVKMRLDFGYKVLEKNNQILF